MVKSYAFLEVIRGEGKVKKYCLVAREIIIGRHIDNNIVLVDEMVSSHHVKIIFANNNYLIMDLDSLNGLTVNGEAVPHHLRRKPCMEAKVAPDL